MCIYRVCVCVYRYINTHTHTHAHTHKHTQIQIMHHQLWIVFNISCKYRIFVYLKNITFTLGHWYFCLYIRRAEWKTLWFSFDWPPPWTLPSDEKSQGRTVYGVIVWWEVLMRKITCVLILSTDFSCKLDMDVDVHVFTAVCCWKSEENSSKGDLCGFIKRMQHYGALWTIK